MITNVAVSTHADGCSTISPCVQQLLSKGNAGSSSQFCSPIAEFDLHVNVSVARPIAPVGTFGVPAMRGPAAPDRHAARSRGDPEDPRAPRPLPLGQCPGPRPRVQRRRVLIGFTRARQVPACCETLPALIRPIRGRLTARAVPA